MNELLIPQIDSELTFEQWRHHVVHFRDLLYRHIPWLFGDLLNQGLSRFGDKALAVLESTGHAAEFKHIADMAARFPVKRRKLTLDWAMHVEVAELKPKEQQTYLELVETDNLSKCDLRQQIRHDHATTPRQHEKENVTLGWIASSWAISSLRDIKKAKPQNWTPQQVEQVRRAIAPLTTFLRQHKLI